MACPRKPSPLCVNLRRSLRVRVPQPRLHCCRLSSTITSPEAPNDVVSDSILHAPPPSEEQIKSFDPIGRSKRRKKQLPPSRYQYRPPVYYRGPLHPHQPPKPSDPASRVFMPGPFSFPRLEETYHSTLAPDLMTLMYQHHPPGTLPGPVGQRLRTWDDSSPYHKGRPLRKPRGGSALPLLKRNITFRNVPRLEKIHVHAFLEDSGTDSSLVPVAAMVVQAISGVKATLHKAKKSVAQFSWKKGMYCAAGVELRGEDMWNFMAKCVDIVMPRIKDFEGVSGASGDGSGNIGWAFHRDAVGGFPEIEINYDSYPPKKIPKIHITCCTTATTDREARLLLSALGIPFFGKHVN